MLVPHNGSRIKSIELTTVFFVSMILGTLGIITLSVFFTFQYIDTKSILEGNIAYISERDATLNRISEEINKTSELSQSFTKELEKTKSLFQNTSSADQSLDGGQVREGDLAQALDLSSRGYSEYQDVIALLALFQQIETNLPILANMNELVVNQKELLEDLPVYWPVKGARVSMEWGPNIHPVFGSWYIHKGIDLASLTGTPVQSAANGEVTFVGYDLGYGLHIYITHNYGFKTHYSHLSTIKVNKGQKVKQGQFIGNVGTTGLVTGPHLDFQLYLGNELIDPGVYLRVSNKYERPVGNR